MDFVIGFIAGIGTNILSWWILSHLIIRLALIFSSALLRPIMSQPHVIFRHAVTLIKESLHGAKSDPVSERLELT